MFICVFTFYVVAFEGAARDTVLLCGWDIRHRDYIILLLKTECIGRRMLPSLGKGVLVRYNSSKEGVLL